MSYHGVIQYHGVSFDDYSSDDQGQIWTQVCHSCQNENENILRKEGLDDHGSGICGVLGCSNQDESVVYYTFDKSKLRGLNLSFKASRAFHQLVDLLGVLDITYSKEKVDLKKGLYAHCTYELIFFLRSSKSSDELTKLIEEKTSATSKYITALKREFSIRQEFDKVYFTFNGEINVSNLKLETDLYQEATDINKSLGELYNIFK